MKIFDALVVLLFGLMAVVQVNDPDPLLWILLYGSVGLIAGLAFFRRHPWWLVAAVLVGCAVELVATAPGFYEFLFVQEGHSLMEQMSAEAPFVEESREFLGVLIAVVTLTVYAVRANKARRHPGAPPS